MKEAEFLTKSGAQLDLIEFCLRAVVCSYVEQSVTDFDSKGFLIGKLSRILDYDGTYEAARNQRTLETSIAEPLFMGSGHHSAIECNNLHRRLNFAFSQLSGRQQNGGMGTEFEEEYDKVAKQDIINVVKDIMIGLDVSVEDLQNA